MNDSKNLLVVGTATVAVVSIGYAGYILGRLSLLKSMEKVRFL